MDNKKQLIIIPPMSEPVKKLFEVLNGIAAEENIEISLIDDLKELSQFVATTGQCLILASNAKKCATFLQDNKTTLLKNHVKTILFTPKEIPAKTLIKFTKVGLTESILESLPPKTFLYKVKLLLRSIKTSKPQEETEKVVKSLDINKNIASENTDLEIKESESTEENVIDIDRPTKNKKDHGEENVIDYGNPLKGKITPQEDVIDTHWKSDRKKNEELTSLDEDGNSSVKSLEDESQVDMYYRGKQKKQELLVEEEVEKRPLVNLYDNTKEETEKKKSHYQDVIEEGTIKQKKLNLQEDEEELDRPLKEIVELDLEAVTSRKKKQEEEESFEELQKRMLEQLQEEEKKARTREKLQEDLGGHYKGKLSHSPEEEIPELEEEKKEYDNSELEKEGKTPNIELELESPEKNKKRDHEEAIEEKDPHEGEVDQIDNNMIGDAGTVDKIKTRMEGRSKEPKLLDEEENSDDDFNKKKKDQESKAAKETDSDLKALDDEGNDLDLQKKKPLEEENERDREKNIELNLETGEERKRSLDNNQDDESDLHKRSKIERVPTEERERPLFEKQNEEEKQRRERQSSGVDLDKKRGTQSHDSQVDKIDTFYRGSESKKKEHSWDNLLDKNSNLELTTGKGKKNNGQSVAGENKDLGEQTIDYRKLKEEFDQIANGETESSEHHNRISVDNKLKNDDDLGSFQVVEIEPAGLDFSIDLINSIYSKEAKPKQMFSMIANELMAQFHCYSVFYSYKLSDKKFSETYNTFTDSPADKIDNSKKDWWSEMKKDSALFEHYQNKSMTTWRCVEIIKDDVPWEDVELPSWANQELREKSVELIFPYFDGIDRMGMALVYFPEGINPKSSNSILMILELGRTLFLDMIERYNVQPLKEVETDLKTSKPEESNNKVLGFFGGLFGKKKAG